MATNKVTKVHGDEAIRKLLERYACPVPFHQVRTRFLGNIATLEPMASPLQIVKDLWGGELPPFDSLDNVNELLGALINSLWNELTRHQKRNQPFRLGRLSTEPTVANLSEYGRVRLQELDGFMEGLFGGREDIELPERSHRALDHLGKLRAMMAGICELVQRDLSGESRAELETTFRRLPEISRIMEAEIHEAVLSCTRARRQLSSSVVTGRPTLH